MDSVYFDACDEDLDGLGWNVIDTTDCGGVAARFATLFEALVWRWEVLYG